MNWKGILVGAIATLIVTIVAGVAVYYFTKEPPVPDPSENLIYSIEEPVLFETEERKIVLISLRVGNIGDLAANNVSIGVEVDKDVTIVDFDVSMSSDPAGTFQLRDSSLHKLEMKIPVLAPEETVVISLLLDEVPAEEPLLAIKSDGSIGQSGSFTSIEYVFEKTLFDRIFDFLMPLIFVAPLPIGFLIFRERLIGRRFKTVNNSAFLYIHNELVEDAAKMLAMEIENKGGDSYIFSNLAFCHTMLGDLVEAEKLFNIAEFSSHSNHSRGIVQFNRALSYFHLGNVVQGLSCLREAINLSNRQIRNYCSLSKQVLKLRQSISELNRFLEEKYPDLPSA